MIGRSRKKVIEKEFDDLIIVNNKSDKPEIKENGKKFSLKKIVLITFLLVIVATGAFILRFVNFGVSEMIWKVSLTKGSDKINNKSIRYESFRDGIMRISNDGATYVDSAGKLVYTVSYNMKDPIYDENGDYFAIGCRNGNELYLFDTNGLLNHASTVAPIYKIGLSKDGAVSLLLVSDTDMSIYNYKNNLNSVEEFSSGKLIDTGIPSDFAVNNLGDRYTMSYTSVGDNKVYTEVCFITNGGNKVYTDEFNGRYVARVHYFDDTKSFAISDISITFFESENVVKDIVFGKKIKSISYNDRYLAVVYDDSTLSIYDKSGNISGEVIVDTNYDNFYLNGDYVVFIINDDVIIYDERGRQIFKNNIPNVEYVAQKRSFVFTKLLIGLLDGVECILFY